MDSAQAIDFVPFDLLGEIAAGPLLAPTRALACVDGLQELLGRPVVRRGDAAAVIAWGYKPSARVAAEEAVRRGVPLVRLEDGFLRSVAPGPGEAPLSLVVDDTAMYYAAAAPSRLERLIAHPRGADEQVRARALAAQWRAGRLSKYNHARELPAEELQRLVRRAGAEQFVLVVDQTVGDDSIRLGAASHDAFDRMLAAALAENPDCAVVVKSHPDVAAGRKRGHFDPVQLAAHPRVVGLPADLHPASLLEQARAVYVVTSQLGFEALLWGRPVRTFGMPFYAGWGLTRDELASPVRRGEVALESLVHAALVDYPRYRDPESRQACDAERVMEWLALQRRHRERFPPRIHAVGFSFRKRPLVRSFLQGSAVTFVRSAAGVPAGAPVAVWGASDALALAGRPRVRLEDGFLRSVGLGADLVRPLSWVLDGEGIYYDPSRPSGLERLLQDLRFEPALLQRAARLRETIVREEVTKYNTGGGEWRPSARAGKRPILLVAGQVERDASVRLGGGAVSTNMELLRAVRRDCPEAWIVYKPHPDVEAGLRGGGDRDAFCWCDEVAGNVALAAMFQVVDELHVLTSLAGFEALLRHVPVVTWGQPFYAGWGLTRDMAPLARRTRRLSLDELVAGVLIEYPTYVSRATDRYTTPERALEELLAWRAAQGPSPWWRRPLRFLLRLALG